MAWAVRFEDVSKRYRGGPQYSALRDDLARLARTMVAPRLARTTPDRGRVALDHVSFESLQGEAFALIGPNGAGKTTALKLLTRISYPTGRRVRVCRRGLFLLDGKVEAIGDVREVLRSYLDWVDARQLARLDGEALSGPSRTLKIERISFHGAAGVERTAFSTGEEMEIRLRVRAEIPLRRPCFSLGIGHSGTPNMVIAFSMLGDGQIPDLIDGVFEISCHIPRLPLLPRVYQTWCSVVSSNAYRELIDWQPIGGFRVAEGPSWYKGPTVIGTRIDTPVYTDYSWRWRRATPAPLVPQG